MRPLLRLVVVFAIVFAASAVLLVISLEVGSRLFCDEEVNQCLRFGK